MENKDGIAESSTFEDGSPVFKSWNSWYLLVVVCNLIVVAAIYFYFKSI